MGLHRTSLPYGSLGRLSLWWTLSCALVCSGCQPAQLRQPELLVQVSTIPRSATSLDVWVALNTTPANERPQLALPPSPDGYSFVLALPAAAAGIVKVGVGARDPQGCLLAVGQGQLDLQATDRGFGLPLTVSLDTPTPTDCWRGAATIDQVLPTQVGSAGGEVITIDGSGFVPTSVAKVDGVDAVTTWVSFTQLRAIVPPHPGFRGMVPLSVTSIWGAPAVRTDLLSYYTGPRAL